MIHIRLEAQRGRASEVGAGDRPPPPESQRLAIWLTSLPSAAAASFSGGLKRGLLPECHRLADLTEARANELLRCSDSQ